MGAQAEAALGSDRIAEVAKYRRAVFALSWCFLALFAGYNAAQGLQSSLNGALGFINLGVLYGIFSSVCILAPALLQGYESRGHSMLPLLVISGLVYVAMVATNAHPIPKAGEAGRVFFVGLMIFLSGMVGVVAPILWTIQNMYVARCAASAAKASGEADAMARMTADFNGKFFMFFQFAGAVGTGTSSLVLAVAHGNSSRIVLFIVLGVVSLVGSLGFMFIPAMPKATAQEPLAPDAATPVDGVQQRTARCDQTLRLCFSDAKMGLFVPLIFANGCFLSFQFGDYPKTFVTQTLGPDWTGPGLLMFYVANSIASLSWGALVQKKFVRIWTAFVVAFLAQMAVLIILMLSVSGVLPFFKQHYEFHSDGSADVHKQWQLTKLGKPESWEIVMPMLLAALSALGDAAYESFPPAVLQTFFTDDRMVAAMANLKMWQSLGFMSEFIVGAAVTNTQARLVSLAIIYVLSFSCLTYLDKKVAPVSGDSLTVT